MLTIDTGVKHRTCDGLTRRDFLRVGTLGIGGLTCADLMRLQAAGAQSSTQRDTSKDSFVKDKAVVVLYLAGGPSQFETFDPKPDGVGSSTSIAGHIGTRIPGVRFSSYFPKLAERADRLSIVRSLVAKTANHAKATKNMLTGGFEDVNGSEGAPATNPSMGSVFAHARGANDQRTGMPSYAFIPPVFTPVDGLKISSVNPGVESCVLGSGAGDLGAGFAPFRPEGNGGWKELVTPKLPDARLNARRDLLIQLDQLNRRLDSRAFREIDDVTQQAYGALRGGAIRKALDLSLEDPRVVEAYDTSHCPIYGWGNENRWVREGPSTGFPLGRQMLLARRLCEAGSRFVTVVHSNWDMHGGRAIWGIKPGMDLFAPPLDHAVAAFIDDVQQRGLSDDILLVVVGEFGRTSSINKSGGRDHNSGAGVIVFAGGGLPHGQVIGATNSRGSRATYDEVTVDDLCATLMHYLFDVGKVRASRDASAVLKKLALDHGQPIRGLI
jgi:hypothetical protein